MTLDTFLILISYSTEIRGISQRGNLYLHLNNELLQSKRGQTLDALYYTLGRFSLFSNATSYNNTGRLTTIFPVRTGLSLLLSSWGNYYEQATTGRLHNSHILLLHVIFIQAIIKPFYFKYLLFILFQTLIKLEFI